MEPTHAGTTEIDPLLGASVLVVEDEVLIQREIASSLSAFGFGRVDTAASADEAIARAVAHCPDIVVMDIRIKGNRDGIEAGRVLRRDFGAALIYLTSHSDSATIARAASTMPHGYLTKPIHYPNLRTALKIAIIRNRAEQALREQERWFSTTIDSIADGVVTVDRSGSVTYMNAVAERLLARTASASKGQPIALVAPLRLTSEDETHPIMVALDGKRSQRVVAKLSGRNNAPDLLVGCSAAPVIDSDKLLGAVMVFRDMNDEQAQQKQLEMADRLASLGTLAAGVAHEINNPLTALIGNLEMLRDEQSKDEAEVLLTDCDAAARAIATIVRDLGTMSRFQPADRLAHCDVLQAVNWAVRIASIHTQHVATVAVDVPSMTLVDLDETRLGQIVLNLIVNAAHAFGVGRIAQNAIMIRAAAVGSKVTIEVEDNGPGMPQHVRDRAFEPFYTTKGVGRGTGLGLSICHGLVVAAGGSIHIHSQEGRGTCVSLTLPRHADPAQVEHDPAGNSRVHVLVVDDEPFIRTTIGRTLSKRHDVSLAASGEAALAEITRAAPDVIVCDITMPQMSGKDFFHALSAQHPALADRVIFMTGGAVNSDLSGFLQNTARPVLQKPFAGAVLEAALQSVLRESKGR